MPSLKEVKTRIASVNSTRKITSAMKMVASSKLHKAQQAVEHMLPYQEQLSEILSCFVKGMDQELMPSYVQARKVERVALIIYTSNSSLCGGYNANVIKKAKQVIDGYLSNGVKEVGVCAIGRKAAEAMKKMGYPAEDDHAALLDKPTYAEAADIARYYMEQYVAGRVDRVDLIYHHFQSTSTQLLRHEQFLPVNLISASDTDRLDSSTDYIVEPSVRELVEQLIPKTLHLQVYAALLDSLTSEHAARVIAMQVATDNADELLQDLTLMYNKSRQQAITTELLDIVGGSMQ